MLQKHGVTISCMCKWACDLFQLSFCNQLRPTAINGNQLQPATYLGSRSNFPTKLEKVAGNWPMRILQDIIWLQRVEIVSFPLCSNSWWKMEKSEWSSEAENILATILRSFHASVTQDQKSLKLQTTIQTLPFFTRTCCKFNPALRLIYMNF